MNAFNTSVIDLDILDAFADLVKIRRHIHAHPEVGPEQPETVKYIKEQLAGLDPITMIEGDPKAGLVVDITGSGPGPTLSLMFGEAGHQVALYDCFYAADPAVLSGRYDFITAIEVVEHLHRPGEELARLWSLLRPGAPLGLMTKLVRDRDAFSRWHYKNDLTHVSFFSRPTFEWLAGQWRADLELIGQDVIILTRTGS